MASIMEAGRDIFPYQLHLILTMVMHSNVMLVTAMYVH